MLFHYGTVRRLKHNASYNHHICTNTQLKTVGHTSDKVFGNDAGHNVTKMNKIMMQYDWIMELLKFSKSYSLC